MQKVGWTSTNSCSTVQPKGFRLMEKKPQHVCRPQAAGAGKRKPVCGPLPPHMQRRIRYIFCNFSMLKSILSPIPEADGECRAFWAVCLSLVNGLHGPPTGGRSQTAAAQVDERERMRSTWVTAGRYRLAAGAPRGRPEPLRKRPHSRRVSVTRSRVDHGWFFALSA